MRANVKQWYDSTLYSRLDSKKEDVIILVMQRLHVDDLVSHVLTKEIWVHLDLPAIADVNQEFLLSDGRRCSRKAGKVLHPEREPENVLENIKNNIGTMAFSAQYQQRPVAEEGNMIRWKWFRQYESPPSMYPDGKIIQSWDTASTINEMSDYSVCTTWQVQGDNFYLIDVFREKLEYPDLIRAITRQAGRYDARSILIEDSAAGIALIQQLRRKRNGLSIIKVKPEKDKVTRLHNASVAIEAGRVFLPEKEVSWMGEFKKECLAFPAVVHDDQVDSVSQFLNWYDNRSTMAVIPLRGL